jgi:hypothetical protein
LSPLYLHLATVRRGSELFQAGLARRVDLERRNYYRGVYDSGVSFGSTTTCCGLNSCRGYHHGTFLTELLPGVVSSSGINPRRAPCVRFLLHRPTCNLKSTLDWRFRLRSGAAFCYLYRRCGWSLRGLQRDTASKLKADTLLELETTKTRDSGIRRCGPGGACLRTGQQNRARTMAGWHRSPAVFLRSLCGAAARKPVRLELRTAAVSNRGPSTVAAKQELKTESSSTAFNGALRWYHCAHKRPGPTGSEIASITSS